MLVCRLDDIIDTERTVKVPNGNWVSRRLSLKDDNMGFSLHDTIIYAGTETYMVQKSFSKTSFSLYFDEILSRFLALLFKILVSNCI